MLTLLRGFEGVGLHNLLKIKVGIQKVGTTSLAGFEWGEV